MSKENGGWQNAQSLSEAQLDVYLQNPTEIGDGTRQLEVQNLLSNEVKDYAQKKLTEKEKHGQIRQDGSLLGHAMEVEQVLRSLEIPWRSLECLQIASEVALLHDAYHSPEEVENDTFLQRYRQSTLISYLKAYLAFEEHLEKTIYDTNDPSVFNLMNAQNFTQQYNGKAAIAVAVRSANSYVNALHPKEYPNQDDQERHRRKIEYELESYIYLLEVMMMPGAAGRMKDLKKRLTKEDLMELYDDASLELFGVGKVKTDQDGKIVRTLGFLESSEVQGVHINHRRQTINREKAIAEVVLWDLSSKLQSVLKLVDDAELSKRMEVAFNIVHKFETDNILETMENDVFTALLIQEDEFWVSKVVEKSKAGVLDKIEGSYLNPEKEGSTVFREKFMSAHNGRPPRLDDKDTIKHSLKSMNDDHRLRLIVPEKYLYEIVDFLKATYIDSGISYFEDLKDENPIDDHFQKTGPFGAVNVTLQIGTVPFEIQIIPRGHYMCNGWGRASHVSRSIHDLNPRNEIVETCLVIQSCIGDTVRRQPCY